MYIVGNRPGQTPFQLKKMRVVNRGGTTALVVGDLMCFDMDSNDDATKAKTGVGGVTLAALKYSTWSNIVDLDTASSYENVMCCIVTNLLSGRGADNTEVEVALSGELGCKVAGTDWSIAYSSNGAWLMGDVTGANRQLILAVHNPAVARMGIINEDIATNLTAATAIANVVFNGWANSVGLLGD